ncbi:MAG TPA: glycosyl hydrolase [Humisphaera sp.]
MPPRLRFAAVAAVVLPFLVPIASAAAPSPAARPSTAPATAPAAAAARTLAKYEPPDGSVYHGVCLTGFWSRDEFARSLAKWRAEVTDRPLVLQSWFAHCKENGKWRTWHWMDRTPDGGTCVGEARDYAETSRRNGLVPVIAWAWMDFGNERNSPRLQDLVAGKYDWYLDDWIKGVRDFRDPVFIRLSHEMDGDWYPYSEGYKADPKRNTAADYVAYYKYVVDRFRRAGVTNVAWVWCVNGDRSGGKDWPDYYPGDAYVDWLGIDVYSSRNPTQMIGEFATMYAPTGKPIMIPEGGTGPEQTKWNKAFKGDAAWTAELFDAIEATPRVKAVCWFQYGKGWDLQRDAGQLAEYRRRIAGERYGAKFVP